MLAFAPVSLFFTLTMSILITREQIIESLPVGASEKEARSYLEEVAGDVDFVTRETERAIGRYTWSESEIGYLQAGIDNARSKWWKPSFGSYLTIRVGISAERNVTHIEISGSRGGFP